jgi:hypothetical protein
LVTDDAKDWSTSSGSRLISKASTIRMTPRTTHQIPATVTSAARVAPGLASASTPSGISSSPRMSSSHQSGMTRRAANAPVMVMPPATMSQAPRTIATATRPGPGHTMMAIPVATESRPVMTLACLTRASMPPYASGSVVA